MSDDLFGALEDRTEEAGGGGDYADWWDPTVNGVGDELIGVVVELHSEPADWTEPGEVPDDVRTVLSVGRGDFEAGDAYTPKQHKQLKQALSGVGVGDMVRLHYTGYGKPSEEAERAMYNYEAAVIPREEWEQMEGSEEVQAALDGWDGISGDNRRTTPYTGGDGGGSGGSGGPGGSGGDGGGSANAEAAEALSTIVEIQGGSVELAEANQILNDVRGYDVDAAEVAPLAGLTVEGDTISG